MVSLVLGDLRLATLLEHGWAADMSDAFIKWCRLSTTYRQFLDQADTFSAAGVALIHPVRKTGVLLDVDGNDVPAGLEEIAGLIGRRISTTVNVEWWLSADTNLVCMYHFLPGGREVQTYYLDGMLLDELALVKDLLYSQFWAVPGVSESLVVDGTGRTVEFDWERYLLYGVGRPPAEPDLMIVRANALPDQLPSGSMVRNAEDGFVEFRRPQTGSP